MALNFLDESDEKNQLFQVFFLKDNESQSVEVDEINKINFERVVQRLKQGESVFISRKKSTRKQYPYRSLVDAEEVWYFGHI